MIVGIIAETVAGENRVALVPANIAALTKLGVQSLVQAGAGNAAGFCDADYQKAGSVIVENTNDVIKEANVLVQIHATGTDLATIKPSQLHKGQTVIGLMDPLGQPGAAAALAAQGVNAFALEMVPRISRAQSMDVLSAMATITGYKAVLLGASNSGRLLPMLMTAAGTLSAAKVFIMGVGVAGLQAAATAKRLGAVVSAYDVRPAARDQILSVGAKPVELDLQTENSEGAGGYANTQSDEFIQRQRELMTEVLAQQDIVITTAAIPGAKSPVLITAGMVKQMKPGTVIVDLAAERGGNCELTQLGQTVVEHGVTILGPDNLASTVANHASQMYGKNIENLLKHILNKDSELEFDFEDQILAETLVAYQGEVVNERISKLLEQTEQLAATA